MKISVMCPDRAGGFSLLELVVVLAILGMVSAIALPNLVNLYESVSRRADLETFAETFNSLNNRARIEGRRIVVRGDKDDHPSIIRPADWRLEVLNPIVFHVSGGCRGGEISLVFSESDRANFALKAPYCDVEIGDL